MRGSALVGDDIDYPPRDMVYYCDSQRHLVCKPYSVKNLHIMAGRLGIRRCWFHKDHYDIPKTRMRAIQRYVEVVRPREILAIIKGFDQ